MEKIKIRPGVRLFATILILVLLSCKKDKIKDSENDNKGDKETAPTGWVASVSTEHPRLFFNKQTFDKVKQRTLNEEQTAFNKIKSQLDNMIGQEIVFEDINAADGTSNNNHAYGTRAAEAAFVFLITEDSKYLNLAKNLLKEIVDYYEHRNNKSLNIHWRAFSRIHTLCAYDWLYNHLTANERQQIGEKLLNTINFMLPSSRPDFNRENRGREIDAGFYGNNVLEWYAGVAFHKTGINDALALKMLENGYDNHLKVIEHRSSVGGLPVAVLEYASKAYPWAEFNFMHTYQSATGQSISSKCTHLTIYPSFWYWNWIGGYRREFGFGDSDHWTNAFNTDFLPVHLSQLLHFYGNSHSEIIPTAKWLLHKAGNREQAEFPLTSFFLTNNTYNLANPQDITDRMPKAFFFRPQGQIFMRSGSNETDTYALFTADGAVTSHRHYDNNHFTIYKRGYLAMDSGGRPEPGMHLPNYYARTVAHNCITIEMPGEVMPTYWGNPASGETREPAPNDGGQNNMLGSKVLAFDEKPEYVYIASDATASYHVNKSALVLRQFVFVLPDIFIVYDQVISKNAAYPKRWLLHTATEPVFNGNTFYADQNEGRLFCRTLLPENANHTKIGGPGKQFWSGGKNWPIPSSYSIPNDHPLLGQWRVETTPSQANTEDRFLHLIQVGDRNNLTSMINSQLINEGDQVGVSFSYDSRDYTVAFSKDGTAKGSIHIKQGSVTRLSENFIETVKPQVPY